jgi:YesN/AraC family two-component response regulator
MKKKLSILIVDDNTDFVGRMISLLSDIDNIGSIDTAANYDDASLLFSKEPDLVLLDIRMPGKSGVNLLKQIKGSSKNCEVIMLSNYASEFYRRQCKELGAMHFLDKTNDFELIPGMIKQFSN